MPKKKSKGWRWIEMWNGEDGPHRGDIIQTNGHHPKMSRTMMVIYSVPMKKPGPDGHPRWKYKAVRWWELDAQTRMALYQSARRRFARMYGKEKVDSYRAINGSGAFYGQQYIWVIPYTKPKKPTLESQMEAVRKDLDAAESEVPKQVNQFEW